jgi:hypothetical protein
MGQAHPSTPEQRAQWAAFLLTHQGEYGIVTKLSREQHISRPTLYAWRDQASLALRTAFSPTLPPALPAPSHRSILTLWINHVSERGIQAALDELLQRGLSLQTITSVLHEAQQRAIAWMQSHVPASTRALALDEIYTSQRSGAYLNVVDVQSGAVWASEGPLPVDSESWILLLWSLQERGLRWNQVVMDEGAPMHSACQQATPQVRVQLDQWHLWHVYSQVQARLERQLQQLSAQTAVVARQAARLAAGKPTQGRRPKSDMAAHAQELAAAERVAAALRYLGQELQRLLEVVVLGARGLLSAEERQVELDALLGLMDELVGSSAPAAQQELRALARRVRRQLPKLLSFVAQVSEVQQALSSELGEEQQGVVGWAWLRRKLLEWTSEELVAALPLEWRSAAQVLIEAWEQAVRVSSAVERWHSILRPHLAVRRKLSTGQLALLAVWHNHRVFSRGVHKGQNPLHLSGMCDAPTDWLVALGYPPEEAVTSQPALLAKAA